MISAGLALRLPCRVRYPDRAFSVPREAPLPGGGLLPGTGTSLAAVVGPRSALFPLPSPVLPSAGRPGGREVLWFWRAPQPRGCVAVSCAVLGGEGEGCPARRMGKGGLWSLSRRCGGLLAEVRVWGARPVPSSVGNACVGACRGAKVGTRAVRLTPAHVS